MPVFVGLALVALTDARTTPSRARAATGASTVPSESVAGTGIESAAAASNPGVVIDEKTGIRFTKFKAISGGSDVIDSTGWLNLSPNGKYLLNNRQVVPLDGSAPFDLLSRPKAYGGGWSPDGRKVVFYDGGIWLIDVDPETGRAASAARRLLEQEERHIGNALWSSDSTRIAFRRFDSELESETFSAWKAGRHGRFRLSLAM